MVPQAAGIIDAVSFQIAAKPGFAIHAPGAHLYALLHALLRWHAGRES